MPADFTWKQGDSGPFITDFLTNSDGSVTSLQGATVSFVLRSLTSAQPYTLTGTTTVTDYTTNAVMFSPSVADTSNPAGEVMGNWSVVYGSGQPQTFPTQGYLWGVIEPALSSVGQQLVSLPYVKDYIASFGTSPDRTHDMKLLRYIQAATPLIENIVGPVIIQNFEEWHDGGQYFIKLRRRPSRAMGGSPVLTVVGCDEYRGPIKYPLSIIADPTAATIYSAMLDPATGSLYRRTTGGGVITFAAGPWGGGLPQAVHVVYQAGHLTVPPNVQEATAEAVRVNYQTTLATGRGSRTRTDEEDTGPPLGYYLPRRCLELLSPNRRHPSIG